MSEFDPSKREKALRKTGLSHVGSIDEPQNLHIEPRGQVGYALVYEIPSSSPTGGKLKFETKIDASQVFTLIEEGKVRSPKDEI